ncbi:MAG: hypothetical protein N3D75_03000 [Candidatus Aenigmarchaeota archaeon]|nr:hypothetical protein [Candidatus Aenigmarchaeota archaeon]
MMFWLILFLLIQPAYAQVTVGVSPPVVDLGEVDRGETRIVRFNIISSTQSTLVVRMDSTNGKADFFQGQYNYMLYNYSEEDTSKWIEFLSNPIELQPSSFENSNIKASKEVTFLLKVPESSESGYHSAYVMLDPKGADTRKQISIKSVFPLTVIFQVPGSAFREIKIYDTKISGASPGTVYFETIIQNTGNVTILVKGGRINIYDENESYAGFALFPSFYIKPQEIKTVKTLWNTDVKLGRYKAQTIIDYSSNVVEKNSSFVILEKTSMPVMRVIEKPKINWWILLIILLVIAFAYYWYKRD